MAEDEGADEAGDIPGPVGTHGHDEAHGRVRFGEEDFVEYDSRCQRVELEIHELHGRAQPAAGDDFD